MSAASAIVHLIGYPGAGKYTIARHLARAAEEADGHRFVVVDNHHTSNVIFAVLDVDGVRPVGREVWERVGEVREVLYKSIEELSPRGWSFVFTNVLNADEPADHAAVPRLVALAASRSAIYVPVVLTCERAELLRRVANPERQTRMKWIDPAAVGAFVDEHELLDVSEYNPLNLDVTKVAPDSAAQLVLDHVRRSIA